MSAGTGRGVPGFFDPDSGGPVQVELEQDGEQFKLNRRIGYRDARHREPFVVPADLARFRTDLASIPWFFAWLVPAIGRDLPAVLLHDGLVLGDGERRSHLGPAVGREEADRIFRDALALLGIARLRRWLIWTATTAATAWQSLLPRWRWRAAVGTTVGVVPVLGGLATLDFLDLWDVLPWMGARSWPAELLGGAAGALAVPLLLSLLWGRLRGAGLVLGVALAFLVHVTVAVVLTYGVYRLAEAVVSVGDRPRT